MIPKEKTKPVFRKQRTKQDEQKFNRVLGSFFKIVKAHGTRQVKQGALKFDGQPETLKESGEKLLALRKELVNAVKAGMIERKDGEEIIALLAMQIWFGRQSVERQAQILAEWG